MDPSQGSSPIPSCDFRLSKMCTWSHPVNLIEFPLGEVTYTQNSWLENSSKKILKGEKISFEKSNSQKKFLRVTAHPSLPRQQANILLQFLITVWGYGPSEQESHGNRSMGQLVILYPQPGHKGRWIMKLPISPFYLSLPRAHILYSKMEIICMGIFWRWWLSHGSWKPLPNVTW